MSKEQELTDEVLKLAGMLAEETLKARMRTQDIVRALTIREVDNIYPTLHALKEKEL
jgi:hypothetical protein